MTLDDAVEHYQSQVPRLRTDFKKNLVELRERFTQGEKLFTPSYVNAIFNAAEGEIRKRNHLAAQSLLRAIDSGLRLRENQVQSSFAACFARLDYRRDSFSDIPDTIIDATRNLGRSDSELEARFNRHVSEIFAQAGKEQIAEIKMHIKQLEGKSIASRKDEPRSSTVPRSGLFSAMTIDEQQLVILRYLEKEGDEAVPGAQRISEGTGIDVDTTCDELTLLERTGLVYCVRPDGYAVRDGRFHLDDGGRALLSEMRKESRAMESEKQRVIGIATNLFDADFRRDQIEQASAARTVLAECASRGIKQSGAMVYAVETTISEGLRKQADQIVNVIHRVVTQSGIVFTAKELQELFDRALERTLTDAKKLVNETIKGSGLQSAGEGSGMLGVVQAEVRGRAHAELELLITAERKTSKGERQTNETGSQKLMERGESTRSRRVFVVHGHDEEMKQAVARTLERLDFKPLILQEQPGSGRTLIEKFEAYADVGFAVVLLAPDDDLEIIATHKRVQRARQNALLELGFFVGRLGRPSVAAIFRHSQEFEHPTDYLGVEYIPYDKEGAWRMKLVRELSAAGYLADANRLH